MPDEEERYLRHDGPIHLWFELTYAQYLTIPRSLLQEMPLEWQERFVACLNELGATFDWVPQDRRYWVCLKDLKGRYVRRNPIGKRSDSSLSSLLRRPLFPRATTLLGKNRSRSHLDA